MNAVAKMLDREARLNDILYRRAATAIKIAHPETDGHFGMVHNWGNAAARAILADHYRRSDKIAARFEREYHRLCVKLGWRR